MFLLHSWVKVRFVWLFLELTRLMFYSIIVNITSGKMMKRIIIVTLFLVILVGAAYSDGIKTNSLDLVNTGLTLPKSMHQFSFYLAYERSDMEKDVSPGLWYQYGITDRLTLDFIGLKYSFWGSGSPLEMAVRGGLGHFAFGYGSESGGVFRVGTYNYIECRYRLFVILRQGYLR